MAWIVSGVKIGAEGEGPATDVMEINRLGNLADIANLGLTLAETKRLLAGLQQEVFTDQNDARGLAQIVRTGWYREVAVKSVDSQLLRSLLTSRAQLVRMRVDLANQTRGTLKPFGLVVGKGGGRPFIERVHSLVAGRPLQEVAEALLTAWQAVSSQVAALSRRLVAIGRQDMAVKRLMTAPGVGTLVAMAYVSVIDAPERFANSSKVGAYVGLTPRRDQSGEEDYTGRILRCGDKLLRTYLFEAAGIILHRVSKWSALKAWGTRLAKRVGTRKATVAVARKLAVILYRMLRDGHRGHCCGSDLTI